MQIEVDEHRIATPGGRLYARRWRPGGAAAGGAPLILFHDSLGCVELWRDFPALLCQQAQRAVIAYDRLGFGRSDARSDTVSPAFIGEEASTNLPCLLRHFDVQSFAAFGHSVGGGMVLHCAAAMPQGCAAVVTEAAQAFVEERTLEGLRAAQAKYADPEPLERLRKYHGDKSEWVLRAWLETWLDPHFRDWSLRALLPRVRCPILAIHGACDEYGSVTHPEIIHALAGGPVEVHILPEAGHVPHKEIPETIAGWVASFLASVDAR
jgi:pimeloyl-ACP methyl ester carboxylesterase